MFGENKDHLKLFKLVSKKKMVEDQGRGWLLRIEKSKITKKRTKLAFEEDIDFRTDYASTVRCVSNTAK